MAWTVVVNPAAGRGRTRRLLPELARRAESHADITGIHVAASADDARAHARKAADGGDDLVAVGGDGLVGLLAGVAAETGRRLALVPTGAGNDFAASLGYDTKHPLDAFGVLACGLDRAVDLGRARTADAAVGTWYTGVTATGFDAEANRWANEVSWLRGTPLYVAATFRTLVRYRPRSFTVTVDGEAHDVEAWMVSVGNNSRYAGGMHITPAARMDDGLLDVCVIGPLRVPAFMWSFPKVFSGRHVEHPLVTTWRGTEVGVAAHGDDDLEVWADGEQVGPLPATMTAVRAALTVLVPPG
jgi:diacylglycerol kinase (ATP)